MSKTDKDYKTEKTDYKIEKTAYLQQKTRKQNQHN